MFILHFVAGLLAPRRIFAAVLGLMLAFPLSAALAGDSRLRTPDAASSTSFNVLDQQSTVTLIAYTLDTANLRSDPDRNAAVISKIPHSTQVTALGRDSSTTWIYVDYQGVWGWIHYSLLQVQGNVYSLPVVDANSGPQPTPTAGAANPGGPVTVTTQSAMRIRACASTSCASLARVSGGVTLTPTARSADGKWVFVQYTSVRGYMAAWLMQVNGDISTLPVTSQPGSAGPASSPAPGPSGGFALGGQTHTLYHPNEMRYAGMSWVKFQHKWLPGQHPSEVTWRIQQAHSNGLKVLLSITGPEYPSSIDFGGYVSFVKEVAAAGADAIEIWNEMNLNREWPTGQISPSSYTNDMLKPAYQAIKSVNPNTVVISGALAPTGFDDNVTAWSDDRYLRGMRDAGAGNSMDCLGIHYNAGATSPDATTGHPADPGPHHYSWYFKPTLDLYSGVFSNEKLCFTELGYVTGEGYGPLPSNFWWGGDNTVGEQAQWLARALEIARASGKVRLFIVYNVDFTDWSSDPQAGYAIIRPGGGCPACDALHNKMTGN